MKSLRFIPVLCATSMLCAPVSAFAWMKKACTQANALCVLTNGTTVTAHVPNGAWYTGATGIRVVTLEGPSTAPVTIPTPGIVNACSAHRTLHEVVCTANDSDVYLIKGTSLVATLQSGAAGSITFSGGTCTNCSVAVNPITQMAYISEAYGSNPAVQALNIRKQTFGAPFPLANGISESLQIDTVRNLLLSPTEYSIYDIIQLGAGGAVTAEFANSSASAEYDGGAEDCLTGLTLASDEFTGNLFVANMNSATFDTGTMTWSATGQGLINFPEFETLSAGTTGLAVAPDTHYAVVAGEFGGDIEGFINLPASGIVSTASLHEYVIATLPTDPAGNGFYNGYDPHSETAYVSPTTGKAHAIFADWAGGAPDYLALVDIHGILAAPRVVSSSGGKHAVNPSYDLVANNVVTFLKTY